MLEWPLQHAVVSARRLEAEIIELNPTEGEKRRKRTRTDGNQRDGIGRRTRRRHDEDGEPSTRRRHPPNKLRNAAAMTTIGEGDQSRRIDG